MLYVDQTHHGVVIPTTQVAGNGASGRPDGHGKERYDETDTEGHASAEHGTGHRVAPEVVGTQRMAELQLAAIFLRRIDRIHVIGHRLSSLSRNHYEARLRESLTQVHLIRLVRGEERSYIGEDAHERH